jgi:hypothetical protein
MLPKIMPSRLQRIVADTEFGAEFKSFDELCQAVSETSWAKSFDLNAGLIGALIVEHKTITVMEKPESVTLPPETEKTASVEDIKVVKTYDEGGKGKKQCTSCKKYVGVRNTVCPCGNPFPSKSEASSVEEEKVVKIYDEGGKGKKQCASCKKYVGVRNTVCPCGNPFAKAEKNSVPSVVVPSVPAPVAPVVSNPDQHVFQRNMGGSGSKLRICAAAGSCPHRLDDSDETTVEAWAERCRKTYMDRDGSWLTTRGLKYFVRQFYRMSDPIRGENPEYRKICNVIETLSG